MVTQLLNRGADVNLKIPGKLRSTALLAAVDRNHAGITKVLLEHGADVSIPSQDNHNLYPLHRAARFSNTEIVKLLLDYGADPVGKDGHGCTAMYDSAMRKDGLEICKLLVSASPSGSHFSPGWREETPLHAAAKIGSLDVLSYLINISPDIDAVEKNGASACCYAALNGHLECVRLLLDHGANHSAAKFGGSQPIHAASVRGHVQVMALLLDWGADCEAKNDNGETPLFSAACSDHPEAVEFLLKKGAHVSSINSTGNTALNIAVHGGKAKTIKVLLQHGAKSKLQLLAPELNANPEYPLFDPLSLRNDEVVDAFLEQGIAASSFVFCKKSESPLNMVSLTGNLKLAHEVIGDLLTAETKPDQQGRNALHCTALGGNGEIFDFLLERGFDLNGKDRRNQTVLHYAAASSSTDMVSRVLQLSNMSELNSSGAKWTPLHWAARGGCPEILDILLEAGVQETFVDVSDPAGSYSPWSLAHFCNNSRLIGDDTKLVLRPKGLSSISPSGKGHKELCDSCMIVSYLHKSVVIIKYDSTLKQLSENIWTSVSLQRLRRF